MLHALLSWEEFHFWTLVFHLCAMVLVCYFCESIWASILYAHVTPQLIRRPKSNYMETLQRDITKGMRGILIDWLVEVCLDCFWLNLCINSSTINSSSLPFNCATYIQIDVYNLQIWSNQLHVNVFFTDGRNFAHSFQRGIECKVYTSDLVGLNRSHKYSLQPCPRSYSFPFQIS